MPLWNGFDLFGPLLLVFYNSGCTHVSDWETLAGQSVSWYVDPIHPCNNVRWCAEDAFWLVWSPTVNRHRSTVMYVAHIG